MKIRPENKDDHDAISEATAIAFEDHPFSQQTEHLIIDELRKANALTVSLVAVNNEQVIEHVAFSPVSKPHRCIKKMKKTSPNVMGFESKANPGQMTGTNQQYIPGSVRFFFIFFTLRESRRASDPALPRVRSSLIRHHPWRLSSEALRLLQRWGISDGTKA
jgi:hypothetical protein